MTSHCPDCNILHAPDFHKPKKVRKAKSKLKVGDRVIAVRSLRWSGMAVDADAVGEIFLVSSNNRMLVKFGAIQGWVSSEYLERYRL